MPKLRSIKRKDLISFLHQLDFTGPYVGGKHEYMQRGRLKVRIPNPHQSDISIGLLRRILEEAEVSLQELGTTLTGLTNRNRTVIFVTEDQLWVRFLAPQFMKQRKDNHNRAE